MPSAGSLVAESAVVLRGRTTPCSALFLTAGLRSLMKEEGPIDQGVGNDMWLGEAMFWFGWFSALRTDQ